MTHTIYSVWSSTSYVDTLVLVSEDAGPAKFIGHAEGNEAFIAANAIEAVTGQECEVVSITKDRFVEKFGVDVANSVYMKV